MKFNKNLIGVFIIGIFMISMVSAVWWNPFTWFNDNDLVKEGGWYLDHIDGIQLEYFDYNVENLDNGKAKICLIPNTDLRISDNIIQESRATLKLNNIDTGIVEPSDMELESEGGNIIKMCVDVDYLNEDYIKFGENSAQFEYTSESITAYDDGEYLGELSLTSDFEYLNGKPNIQTGVGKDLLTHTFYIDNYQEDSITNLRSINMKNGEEVERNAKIKYLTYEERTFYTLDCPTEDTCYKNGTKIKLIPIWKDDLNEVIGQDVLLGIFTDTKQGDYVDIDFDFYGISVLESPIDWASWEASLDTDIIWYYTMDDNAGNTVVIDSAGNYNGTGEKNTNLIDTTTAKLGTAFDFTATSYDNFINMGGSNILGDEWAISAWIRPGSDITTEQKPIAIKEDQNAQIVVDDSAFYASATGAGGNTLVTSISTNTWYHVVFMFDEPNELMEVWVNGVSELNHSTPGNAGGGVMTLGADNGYADYKGILDEVGLWDRLLTDAEIATLYGEGNPPEYGDIDSDSIPEVILNTPVDNENFSITTINFNVTVTDDINLLNVSLLIDGSIDQTNTSGYNGTYIFTKALTAGEHNWSIHAYDNNSQINESVTRTFNITVVPPEIELSIPIDNLYTTTASQTFYAYVTDDYNVENVSLYYDGSLDQTNTSRLNASNYTFSKTLTEGSHTWYIKAFDNDSLSSDSATRTIILDTTVPVVNIVNPSTDITVDYFSASEVDYNFTISDNNIDKCWWSNDDYETNTSITCNNNISVNQSPNNYNLYFCGNDSVGYESCTNKTYNINVNTNISLNFAGVGETLSPTCTINHGSISDAYNWIGETINRDSNLSCQIDNYVDKSWTIYPNVTEYNLTMSLAYLNLTFDNNVDAVIVPYTGSEFTNITNIYLNQSDIGEGQVQITYNSQEDGGVQIFTYYNDFQTTIEENLHVTNGTFQQVEVSVKNDGFGLEDALVRVYAQTNGNWKEIYSSFTNKYGTSVVYVIPDSVYKFTASKSGYISESQIETIITAQSEAILINLEEIESESDIVRFFSNCGGLTKEKDCYLRATTTLEKTNITIRYYYNGSYTSYTCDDSQYCSVNDLHIDNDTSLIIGNLWIENELNTKTIRIEYGGVRTIDIDWPNFDIEDDVLRTIFYLVTLLGGLFMMVSIESKKKGWGKYVILLWYGFIATTGFGLYWLIVIPTTLLLIAKFIGSKIR